MQTYTQNFFDVFRKALWIGTDDSTKLEKNNTPYPKVEHKTCEATTRTQALTENLQRRDYRKA